jgi:hypothetical protein
MIPFERMGVFATAEEIQSVKHAAAMPMMAMTNPQLPGPGVSPVVPMFRSPIEIAHAAALAHGLPDHPGFYGIDLENGEFLKPQDTGE